MSTHRRSPQVAVRVGLTAAILLTMGAGMAGVVQVPAEQAAVPAPAPVAAPVVAVPAALPPASVARPEPVPSTASTSTPTPSRTIEPRAMSAAQCERLAATSPMSNADLRPHLRARGCDEAADGLGVGGGDPLDDPTENRSTLGPDGTDSEGRDAAGKTPGDYALEACREQTGQTTAQCRAQAARGEAS